MVLLIFILITTGPTYARPKIRLTPFQKNIKTCLQDQIDVNSLTTLQKIYTVVSEKYLLISSEILGREVLYKVKDETRKLRYENGQLKLYKILADEDDRAVAINNVAHQKSLTLESYMAELLIHADIRSDWMKVSEKRFDGTVVTLTTTDGEIKTLTVEKTKNKKILDCNRIEGIESCSCLVTK